MNNLANPQVAAKPQAERQLPAFLLFSSRHHLLKEQDLEQQRQAACMIAAVVAVVIMEADVQAEMGCRLQVVQDLSTRLSRASFPPIPQRIKGFTRPFPLKPLVMLILWADMVLEDWELLREQVCAVEMDELSSNFYKCIN